MIKKLKSYFDKLCLGITVVLAAIVMFKEIYTILKWQRRIEKCQEKIDLQPKERVYKYS